MSSFSTICPSTGKKIADYKYVSFEVAQQCIMRLEDQFSVWSHRKLQDRCKLVGRLAGVLRENANEIALSMQSEMGKSLEEGLSEVEKSAFTCDYYAENAERLLARIRIEKSPYAQAEVGFFPLGVIFSVMPWNFPLWQLIRFAVPALITGNVILLKHSDIVAGTAELITKVINTGLESSLIENLRITHETAALVIASPSIKGVTFTGSTEGGRAVAVEAAKNLKKVVLELGGSDAYLVLEDADVSQAARHCAQSRLINSGQSCVSAKRFIVAESVYLSFIDRLKDEFLYAKLAPLAAKKFQEKLQLQVDFLLKNGGKIILGGKKPEGDGAYYPQTIIECPLDNPLFHREELFGPVALVFKMSSLEEGLRAANSSPFGLGGGVFTKDEKLGRKLIEEGLEAGFVVLNDFVKSDPRIPFGGIKNSGYGRELGVFGLLEFVNIKTLGFQGGSIE